MAKAPQTRKKVKWLRYVLLAVGGLGIYHIVSGPSGALNIFKLKKENAKQDRELDSLQARKQELETEKTRLVKDSAYIEKVARKELGMAKPGEKVFRFMPDNGNNAANTANAANAANGANEVGGANGAVRGNWESGLGGEIRGNAKVTQGSEARKKK